MKEDETASFPIKIDSLTTQSIFLRWKSFGLGIILLTFTAWAWIQSNTFNDGLFVGFRGAHFFIWINQSRGMLYVEVTEDGPQTSTTVHPTHEKQAGPGRFPPPFTYTHVVGDLSIPTTRQFAVAHWVIMVLILIPWFFFLRWRWGRRSES